MTPEGQGQGERMNSELKGFEVYPAERPIGGAVFVIGAKTNGKYFSLCLSSAASRAFPHRIVEILVNRDAQQLAIVGREDGARRVTSGGRACMLRLACSALADDFNLQPRIRMPARVVNGVLIVDFSAAVGLKESA